MRTRSNHCLRRIDWRCKTATRALLVPLSLTLVAIGIVPARAASRTFKWNELQKQGNVRGGTVLPPEPGAPFHRLMIRGVPSGPTRVTVLTIDRPQITSPRYSLKGQIQYEMVEGIGYLELWNHFPGGGLYFSRTLAKEGPMMELHGTSGWRPFILPFDATGAPAPTRLVFNVVLEGHGVVYLGPVELTEMNRADAGEPGAVAANRLAGAAGAIAGSVIGCLGALIGLLTSLGRARGFVIATARALIVFGAAAVIAGLVAVASSQPYSVFYPLLLVGVIACTVPLGLLPTIRRRYEEIEFRAMRAHDVG